MEFHENLRESDIKFLEFIKYIFYDKLVGNPDHTKSRLINVRKSRDREQG